MGVVARSDVHVRANDGEDFTLPLLQGSHCELQDGNSLQGHTLAAWHLFLFMFFSFFFFFFFFSGARFVVARQGIRCLLSLDGFVMARRRCTLFLFVLWFRELGCPMFHQVCIEDRGYPLRGLHFSAALLSETLELLKSGSP